MDNKSVLLFTSQKTNTVPIMYQEGNGNKNRIKCYQHFIYELYDKS